MVWSRYSIAMVFCAFLIGSGEARAESIRYCFNDWPPYAYSTDQGATGISVEILTKASELAGYEAIFTELPWERCLRDVTDGHQDAVIDAAMRDEYLQGDISFSVYTNTFWVREGYSVEGPLLSTFEGHRLGLVRGYVYGDVLDRDIARSGAIIDFAKNDEQNMQKLSYGRTDAIIGDFVGTRIAARELGLKLEPALPHHSFDMLYPSFNLNLGIMQGRINEALMSMMADGSIDQVYQDRLGVDFSEIMPKTIVDPEQESSLSY